MIELINVRKRFPPSDKFITDNVSFFVPEGKSLCILGLSGEGKSLLLKQIAGLIPPSEGSILIDGEDIVAYDEKSMARIHQKCGYVFQFAALLDSLTVFENVALPLMKQGTGGVTREIKEQVDEVLKQVNLVPELIGEKYPSEISGGTKKRVGIARTLITKPKIILYDEPTSGLDPINTRIIHLLMRQQQLEKGITSIVISHEREIFDYVDIVAFLYRGKIEYIGDAKGVWNSQDPFISQFIHGATQGPIQ